MPDTTVVGPYVCGSAAAADAEPVLPSERLTRLAGAGGCTGGGGRVDRGEHEEGVPVRLGKVHRLDGAAGVRAAAGPQPGGRAPDGGGRGADPGREVAVHPGDTDPLDVAHQPVPHRRRRDRCLLVMSQIAGVPLKHLAALTVGDIAGIDGTATITGAMGTWTAAPIDDPITCGPCAIARWLRVVDLAVTKINTAVVAVAIDKADAVTSRSPHLCRSTEKRVDATAPVPVFPPIDQWGSLPFPLRALTQHSLSGRVHDLLGVIWLRIGTCL